MESKHWQDWVILIVGVGLVSVLYIIDISSGAGINTTLTTWNFTLVGAATVLIALLAIFAHRDWEEWVALALGAWLIASPWILGFASVSGLRWSALAGGGVILVMAVLALMTAEQDSRF